MFRTSIMTLACAIVSGASAFAGAQTGLQVVPVPLPTVLKQSTALRATPSSQVLHLAISLTSPNEAALEAYVNDISNPKSANFHKWITPAQFGAKFGASNENLLQVENYLRAEGFQIKLVAASHLQILADATVLQAQTAFHTTIKNYHSNLPNDLDRVNYYSIATAPAMPSAIASKISYISGLQNHTMPHPLNKKLKKQAGSGFFNPSNTSVLYDTAPFHTANVNGQGKTVAISNFDGFSLADAAAYITSFGLPVPAGGAGSNITVKTIDGGSQSGTAEGEGDLDIQMVASQAPLSSIVVYDGTYAGSEMDVIVQEANDNIADVLSESYFFGLDQGEAAAAHVIHLQMSAQGQTYCCAAGDTGTFIRGVEPDIDPEVTVVGGTSVVATTSGTRISETGWSDGGGGWLTLSEPFNILQPWQVGNGVPTGINFRLVPDLAMVADPNTGEIIFTGDFEEVIGGTSVASPLFAGSLAVTEQYLQTKGYFPLPSVAATNRMGRLNDLVYAQNGNPTEFFDVISGNNGTLPNGAPSVAKVGWDFVTGWGAPDFMGIAHHLIAPPAQNLAPTSVKIYQASAGTMNGIPQGTDLAGVPSTLLTADGVGYTETTVPSDAGQIAATQMTYQLSTNTVTPVTFATFNFAVNGPNLSTAFVYLQNNSGTIDLVGSVGLTGSTQKYTTAVNLTNYVNKSGQVTVITRTVGPTRLFPNPFSITIDQAEIFENF